MEAQLQQFLHYIQFERGYTANTLAAYHNDLEQLQDFLKEAHVAGWEGVTPDLLDDFLTSLGASEYNPTTIARKVASVRSFFHFLFTEGVISSELAEWLRQPRVGRRLPHALSEEDVQRLIQAADADGTALETRDRALLELMYATGLRATEVVTLTLQDVNTKEGTVRCTGKGNKERLIPLYETACKALQVYIQEARPFLLRDPGKGSLFLNRGGRPLTRQGIWFIIQHYAKKVGLEDRVTPHTLRHTFATHLLTGGAELREVQQFLGHASITTTQIYTEVSNQRKRAVYDQAHPRAFSASGGPSGDPKEPENG
ncbi:MAG: site-specific tyrosine recombinase XerD [Anaerolineae bacterium]|jgi:integrase/recombinase XerD|nr:site-specific tyrosine recombinase XerD [Anaerolineae bacterium]